MEHNLKQLPAGTPVALESSGNWYWLLRAMEDAGLEPRLAHALEGKKTHAGAEQDRSSRRQRTGADAAQWFAFRIPPASLLDLRDLMRKSAFASVSLQSPGYGG